MSDTLIALISSVSIGTWIYTRVLSRTGGNVKSATTVACISGVLIFMAILIILLIVGKMLE